MDNSIWDVSCLFVCGEYAMYFAWFKVSWSEISLPLFSYAYMLADQPVWAYYSV